MFFKIRQNGEKILADNINNDQFTKNVLFKRGMVAADSNPDEGFHTKLKTIANERKGFVYNISNLQDIIYKRLKKYTGDLAAD